MKSKKEISYMVASDVNPRDGIGLETYIDGDLVIEIFRDDTERRTYISLFSKDVDLEVLEASIEKFKERIDVNYIDYPDESEQG